jgi:hypothetical protein
MGYIDEIVAHINKAQEIAQRNGIKNLLQPGLVKELILASILEHQVKPSKHDSDAFDPNDPARQFEYLSCLEGGTFQLDRMRKSPPEKRAKSLERITRNSKIYCAVFSENSPLTPRVIYEVEVAPFRSESERQLDASANDISHIAIPIAWVQKHGRRVFPR